MTNKNNDTKISDTKDFDNFDKFKKRGLSGLANCGNTCYLNACMQILSHTYELNNFLEDEKYKKLLNEKADSVVLIEWDCLRRMMWSENCTIAPKGFVNAIQKVSNIKDRDLFSGNAQNDIQEYLLFIIECFHYALARNVDMVITGTIKNEKDKLAKQCYEMMKVMYNEEYSEMLKIFYGIHVSVITSCKTGETLSTRPEPFSVLSLSIPLDVENPSLYNCFDLYCAKEELSGENAWMNDETNEKEDVNRGIVFWDLPDILIIDLKRWSEKGGNKNHKLVEAPITNADFSKHVHGYNKIKNKFDLYGVCNHSGCSMGGHYTASVKNADGKWYNFNDTIITEVDENNVVTDQAYCFFYRKKNIAS